MQRDFWYRASNSKTPEATNVRITCVMHESDCLFLFLDSRNVTLNTFMPGVGNIEQSSETDNVVTTFMRLRAPGSAYKVTLLSCTSRRSCLSSTSDTSALCSNASLDETSLATEPETLPRAKSSTLIIVEGTTTSTRRHAICSSVNFASKTGCSNGSCAAFKLTKTQFALPFTST